MSGRLRLALTALIAAALGVVPVHARPDSRDGGACAVYAAEAARRTGLPTDIILRVMAAESGGNPHAVSPKGAIGCMQIMPRTWTYLSSRHALGRNPFDPRMNMIGGALYLAELAARYGFPGAYSAYNAGPGRYERFAAGQTRLPAETVTYTTRIGGGGVAPAVAASAPRWQQATLFLVRSTVSTSRSAASASERSDARVSADMLFPLTARDEPQAP